MSDADVRALDAKNSMDHAMERERTERGQQAEREVLEAFWIDPMIVVDKEPAAFWLTNDMYTQNGRFPVAQEDQDLWRHIQRLAKTDEALGQWVRWRARDYGRMVSDTWEPEA